MPLPYDKERDRERHRRWRLANIDRQRANDRERYHENIRKFLNPPDDKTVTEKIRHKALRRGYYD